MKFPLHILHLEDDPNDAALVQSTLAADGIPCAITCVQSRDDFVAALEHGGIDLILSDFTLPAFDGLSALKIAHAGWPDLPVIMVSGTLGEERAVDSLKTGATDYVLKTHLSRLVPAVRRAMQEVETRAEHKRLEGQFIDAQKMEVIGQLASGVAHDFNNILAVIMGYSDMIMSGLGPDGPLREYTEEIRHASKRAAGLTQQLLIFSRKQTVQPVVLDLNDTVKDLDKMLRRLIGDNIEMTIVPGEQTGRIKADSGYVGQVLMNLVVNARDAMPNGGKLTIATNNVTLDESDTHPGAKPGDYVMLTVSDTGTGMTGEVKAHLFEAFFTTKPSGKGTGLGLATCQTIVQQSGGHIGVYSEVGKGTTFKVYFPRVEQPLDAAAQSDQSRAASARDGNAAGRGRRAFRASSGCGCVGSARLPRAAREQRPGCVARGAGTQGSADSSGGYRCHHAGDGRQGDGGMAENNVSRSQNSVHIRVTRKTPWPATAVPEAKVEFLPKPYGPATLARKVREVLDAAPKTAPS